MDKNEIEEMKIFFNAYITRGQVNLKTLESLVSLIKKNKLKIEDDYILIESGILIISQFVFYSKLAILLNSPDLSKSRKDTEKLMKDFESLLQNSYEALDMNPSLIPQMEEMLTNRFSQPKGFEDAELFMASIEKIANTDKTIDEINKKWKELILF